MIKFTVNLFIYFNHLIRSAYTGSNFKVRQQNFSFLVSISNHLIWFISPHLPNHHHISIKSNYVSYVSTNLQGCKFRCIIINKTLMARFNLSFKRIDVGKIKSTTYYPLRWRCFICA